MFFKVVLTILSSLYFRRNLGPACQFQQKKKTAGILSEIVLILLINLGSGAIWTTRAPIHQHGMSFHLLRFPLISSSDFFVVSSAQIFYLFC